MIEARTCHSRCASSFIPHVVSPLGRCHVSATNTTQEFGWRSPASEAPPSSPPRTVSWMGKNCNLPQRRTLSFQPWYTCRTGLAEAERSYNWQRVTQPWERLSVFRTECVRDPEPFRGATHMFAHWGVAAPCHSEWGALASKPRYTAVKPSPGSPAAGSPPVWMQRLQVRALEEKTRDLNGELVTAYKVCFRQWNGNEQRGRNPRPRSSVSDSGLRDRRHCSLQDKSKLAEDLLQTSIQLQIVRENNEMQAKQLNEVRNGGDARSRDGRVRAPVDRTYNLLGSPFLVRVPNREAPAAVEGTLINLGEGACSPCPCGQGVRGCTAVSCPSPPLPPLHCLQRQFFFRLHLLGHTYGCLRDCCSHGVWGLSICHACPSARPFPALSGLFWQL